LLIQPKKPSSIKTRCLVAIIYISRTPSTG
jgi:hypothetical protein